MLTQFCPRCKADATITSWLPPKGFDSRLREFQCPNHFEFKFYVVLTLTQMKAIGAVERWVKK